LRQLREQQGCGGVVGGATRTNTRLTLANSSIWKRCSRSGRRVERLRKQESAKQDK